MIEIGKNVKITRGVTILTHGFDWSVLKGKYGNVLGSCGKVFRTSIAKHILFPTNLPLAEDQVFNHAALHKSKRLIITNIPAYYYILNNTSATHRSRANAVEIMLDAMKEIQKYLFSIPEVQNAYNYRLIIQVLIGIQMAHFYDVNDRCSPYKKYIIMKKIFAADPVRTAVQDIHLDSSIRVKEIFKLWLFKHHIYSPFVLVWSIRNMCMRAKEGKNNHEQK